MKKHILKIREVDGVVFDAIKSGGKTVETMAATGKYRKIQKGDVLVFVCGKEKLEKRVEKAEYFKSVEVLVKAIDFKKIMPFVDSVEAMKKVYFSFPNYQEKIKKVGLVAFKMS